MDSTECLVKHAAEKLDQILEVGASLYLNCIQTDNAPRVRAALGFSKEAQSPAHILCQVDFLQSTYTAAASVDFPVVVDKAVVAVVRKWCVEAYHTTVQSPSRYPEASSIPLDNIEDVAHITRTFLNNQSSEIVALVWLCFPQLDAVAACRRRWLHEKFASAATNSSKTQQFRHLMKEYVLSDLLISFIPKIKLLWEHRHWICTCLLRDALLIPPIESAGAKCLPIARFESQDDEGFFMAAHNHQMNYNAWHYRRQRFSLLNSREGGGIFALAERRVAFKTDSTRVIQFIREHNSDSSAAAYLLFLLHEFAALDAEANLTVVNNQDESHSCLCAQNEIMEYAKLNKEEKSAIFWNASTMWNYLMMFTQVEIRSHGEKGHESMWYLRLGLVQWAWTQPHASQPRSSWTVEDELRWVSAYAEFSSGDGDNKPLSPVTPLPYAWAEASGSSAWTSYCATRYGFQLIRLLQNN